METINVKAPSVPEQKQLPGTPTLDCLARRKALESTWKACCEAWERELAAVGVRVVK